MISKFMPLAGDNTGPDRGQRIVNHFLDYVDMSDVLAPGEDTAPCGRRHNYPDGVLLNLFTASAEFESMDAMVDQLHADDTWTRCCRAYSESHPGARLPLSPPNADEVRHIRSHLGLSPQVVRAALLDAGLFPLPSDESRLPSGATIVELEYSPRLSAWARGDGDAEWGFRTTAVDGREIVYGYYASSFVAL